MPKPARVSLARVPTDATRAKAKRRTKPHPLVIEYDDLLRQLAAHKVKMRASGVAIPRRGREYDERWSHWIPVRGNTMSLPTALAMVLRGKVMSPSQAAEAVQRIGYKSTAKKFRLVVNSRLSDLPQFRKVGYGKYTLAK